MKNVWIAICIILLAMTLSSCGVQTSHGIPVTWTPDALPMNNTPQRTQTPLELPIVATSTPTKPKTTATVSPIPTPDPRLTYQCIDMVAESSQDTRLEGALVIDYRLRPNPDILNLADNTIITLSDSSEVRISPDHRKLAIVRPDPWQLIISSIEGEQLAQYTNDDVPVNLDWSNQILRWLNNDHLLFESADFSRPHFSRLDYWELIIFNPYTGEKKVLSPDQFPDISRDHFLWQWRSLSMIIPDPELTRVVYARLLDSIVLWDLSSDQALIQIYTQLDQRGVTPTWLKDGSAFIVRAPLSFTDYYGKYFENLPDKPIAGGEELLWVTRDGQLRRLTYLTNTYIAHPGEISLSPDERKIAFWLTIEKSELPDERLAVLDIEFGLVTNYCIAGRHLQSEGLSREPFWSPDGKYLAITVKDLEDQLKNNVLVVDLEHNVAIQVAQDAEVIGWVIVEP